MDINTFGVTSEHIILSKIPNCHQSVHVGSISWKETNLNVMEGNLNSKKVSKTSSNDSDTL